MPDLKMMYDYICTNLDSPTMLQYKIYLDIGFYMGRRGKEGLRELCISSFKIKTSPEGRRYIVMTHKEISKKPRGNKSTNSKNFYKDDNNNWIARLFNYQIVIVVFVEILAVGTFVSPGLFGHFFMCHYNVPPSFWTGFNFK